MKKKDLFLNIGILIILIAITSLVTFKFIIKDKKNDIMIDVEKITVRDLSGNKINLSDIILKDDVFYCLFFDMNDCHSCILKGIDDLRELKRSGLNSMALAIHHRLDEVAGWSKNYNYSPYFMIKKKDFYEHIHIQSTPVIVKIKKGKIENFRYIFP